MAKKRVNNSGTTGWRSFNSRRADQRRLNRLAFEQEMVRCNFYNLRDTLMAMGKPVRHSSAPIR